MQINLTPEFLKGIADLNITITVDVEDVTKVSWEWPTEKEADHA